MPCSQTRALGTDHKLLLRQAGKHLHAIEPGGEPTETQRPDQIEAGERSGCLQVIGQRQLRHAIAHLDLIMVGDMYLPAGVAEGGGQTLVVVIPGFGGVTHQQEQFRHAC